MLLSCWTSERSITTSVSKPLLLLSRSLLLCSRLSTHCFFCTQQTQNSSRGVTPAIIHVNDPYVVFRCHTNLGSAAAGSGPVPFQESLSLELGALVVRATAALPTDLLGRDARGQKGHDLCPLRRLQGDLSIAHLGRGWALNRANRVQA